jgi:hypothetical protein
MDKKYEITIDVDTLEDFLKVCHDRAVSDASGKFCKPVPPRQIGELYPEYHRRVIQQLQQEAVACQQYVETEDRVARAVGKEKFG